MIPYILYTALILSACFVFYKLLLQKETFFRLNRLVLLFCMILAFILPLVPAPYQLSLRKAAVHKTVVVTNNQKEKDIAPLVKESNTQPTIVENTEQIINVDTVVQALIYLYWFGVIVFGINFLMQIIILVYRAYSKSFIQDGKFRIVEITDDKAPCSFANNIFINPEKYEWETYNQILLHEKIHIEQKHTIDLLLAELVLIFQWFNPFAWQWRKALEINLEFLTDDQMLQQHTVEKESYQFSLLKVAAPQFPLSLTTNYNQSLLKKRIIMMNSKKSNVNTTWKYFFLLPLMVLFVCLFNQPAAQSQILSSKEKKEQHNEIHNELKTEGNWFAEIKGNYINFQFKNDEDSNSSNTFKLSDFPNLPRDKNGEFSLTREAGTMKFNGKIEGDKGMGTYKFIANKEYSSLMSREGIDITKDKDGDLMVFFILDIKVSYVQMLKKQGYTKLDKDELIPLAALGIDEAYITSIKQVLPDVDLENLIPFKSLGVDKAYIEEIRAAGYKDVSADKIITLKAQGISGKYISDFQASTKDEKKDKNRESDSDDDDVISFKVLNIDQEFIDSFKKIGYDNLSNDELMALKTLNVTPDYIKSFQKVGFKDVSMDNLFALKSLNITPDVITQYKNLGFTDLKLDDIFGATTIGATPSFIKSMKAKGHNFNNLEKYIELKAVLGN